MDGQWLLLRPNVVKDIVIRPQPLTIHDRLRERALRRGSCFYLALDREPGNNFSTSVFSFFSMVWITNRITKDWFVDHGEERRRKQMLTRLRAREVFFIRSVISIAAKDWRLAGKCWCKCWSIFSIPNRAPTFTWPPTARRLLKC